MSLVKCSIYDLYVSFNLSSKAGMRQFGASGNQRIWNCQEPTDLEKVLGFMGHKLWPGRTIFLLISDESAPFLVWLCLALISRIFVKYGTSVMEQMTL